MTEPDAALLARIRSLIDSDARPRHPLPLRAMRIAIHVRNGLAIIATHRAFANLETVPIEATVTFPVAFDAVLTKLSARVDGRELVAVAQRCDVARETYEKALDRGKLSVLHEEKMRGVHVLSVGNLGPGKDVEAIDEAVMPLSLAAATASLRIPTTVGDIYGPSPLLPVDDLLTSSEGLKTAILTVDADCESVALNGRAIAGETIVDLGRAIELTFPNAPVGVSTGRDADGREVRIALHKAKAGAGHLDIGVLFDRSGSTAQALSGHTSVWDAMKAGLLAKLAALSDTDRVSLFQFSDTCEHLGVANGAEAVRLVHKVAPPGGGTEMGSAIDESVRSGVSDLLLMTDGKTWRADVQRSAASGARITAVLVGADSFDAMVGHMAALTGGQALAVANDDVGATIETALAFMRRPKGRLAGQIDNGRPARLQTMRAGCAIDATWTGARTKSAPDAIGRFAAALALPLLDESEASALAEAHGLCTHLTSLVLVDEAGAGVEGIAETRKTPILAAPAFSIPGSGVVVAHMAPGRQSAGPSPATRRAYLAGSPRAPSELGESLPPIAMQRRSTPADDMPLPLASIGILEVARAIDWDHQLNRLLAGDLSGLAPPIRAWIERYARRIRVRALAAFYAADAIVVAVALVARKSDNAGAQRFSRRVLTR